MINTSRATLLLSLALAACGHARRVERPLGAGTSSTAHLADGSAGPRDGEKKRAPRANMENAIVSVVATVQDYDYSQPWAKQRPATYWFTGLVVEGHRILLAGGRLGNATLVEVQKKGLPRRFQAKVELADFELPLALLSVEDPAFWEGLEPPPIAAEARKGADVTIYRWLSTGQMENARGKIRQMRVEDHWPGRVQLLTLDVSSSLDGAGWSEVVTSGGAVVGLSTSKAESKLAAISGTVLKSFLARAKEQPYRGVARGGYQWQSLTNPALRRALGLGPDEGGIRVHTVLPHGSVAGAVQPGDVLLEIAGKAVDNVGQVQHPRYGRLPASVLFTEGVEPGQTIKVKLLRAGKRLEVEVKLKRMAPEEDKVPPYQFGRPPEYFTAGGLVFQHLTRPYLQIWKEWWKRAPLRLLIAHDEDGTDPSPGSPRLVVLTKVLADPANLGYQDLGPMIVTAVNGVQVRTLDDVRAAFAKPVRGFHMVDFLAGQGPRRIVLDAAEVAQSEPRIRERYGVSEAAP